MPSLRVRSTSTGCSSSASLHFCLSIPSSWSTYLPSLHSAFQWPFSTFVSIVVSFCCLEKPHPTLLHFFVFLGLRHLQRCLPLFRHPPLYTLACCSILTQSFYPLFEFLLLYFTILSTVTTKSIRPTPSYSLLLLQADHCP